MAMSIAPRLCVSAVSPPRNGYSHPAMTTPPENEPTDPFDDLADEPNAEREDAEDLAGARRAPEASVLKQPLWKRIGPGVVTGAANDDPVNVGAYSSAGAAFGYALAWVLPVALPLMLAVQEMCGRLAAVTGHGLASAIRQRFPPWIAWVAVTLICAANTVSVWADLSVMTSAARLLVPWPFAVWLVLLTAVTLGLQVFVGYRVYVRYLKWLALAMLSYVVTSLLPAVGVDWGKVLNAVVSPHWSGGQRFAVALVALLGTSLSPYLYFWQAGETVEEEVAEGVAVRPGRRVTKVKESELRHLRADTAMGMLMSVILSFCVLVCAAATLNASGKTHIETARDAAEALRPLGSAAYLFFTAAILAAGLLAVPALAGSAAYAVAETAGWRHGLYRRPGRARGFYLTLAAVILTGFGLNFIPNVSPVRAVMVAAVLNGVVAPPLLLLLLLICNNREVMGSRTNGRLSNIFGTIAALVMLAAALAMLLPR